jgi:tetraacyldisaccharide-1-P 4'-kinase
MGLRVAGHHWFGDHHVYTEDDICMIWEEAERVGAEIVVVTSKDVVKWRRGRPVCILEIETQVDERFWGWLKGQLEEMRA